MKSIQKRIYSVLPRVAGTASSTPASSSTQPSPISASSGPSPPRVRSNSLSSSSRPFHTASSGISPLAYFDTPPPPSSRPSIPSPSRLPVEAKPTEIEGPPHAPQGQSSQANGVSHPPLSLALTQPQSNAGHALVNNSHGPPSHHSLLTYSLTSAPNLHPADLPTGHGHQSQMQAKKHKPRYQLYVGAYGIPKKCAAPGISAGRRRGIPTRSQSTDEDMGLAVQVGEDAYFVRDNAMGVADGVGGWSKGKAKEIPLRSAGASSQPTPSALFARRLMHYCSAEVDTLSGKTTLSPPPSPLLQPPSQPHFAFSYPKPRTPSPILVSHASPWHWSDACTSPALFSTQLISSSLPSSFTFMHPSHLKPKEEDISALEQDLEDTLEELSEGIDVLQILEKAYDHTLKAHVVPAPESPPDSSRSPSPPISKGSRCVDRAACNPIDISCATIPVKPMSTKVPEDGGPDIKREMVPLMSGSSTALLAVLDHVPRKRLEQIGGENAGSGIPSISTTTLEAKDGYDAVIKIAHVGDCMGMLVRGEEIAWRSEEMWWNFNTPVQLGPSTPTTPRSSAHVFTLPVRADDILILATDGLSDNLWDEDVLDEVVRFRRSFLGGDSLSPCATHSEGQIGITGPPTASPLTAAERVLRRRTLAGMLSEALCSRARRVSERKYRDSQQKRNHVASEQAPPVDLEEDEVPFARRAREVGKVFRGGKNDDISVIVAVISPAADLAEEAKSA
ncbi:hypothetical protein AX17_002431 [Amanita inopinata Kibby_2008]|nr:hypothetical protein AX17_002431 [Amanita inopinata Kibby_2008]